MVVFEKQALMPKIAGAAPRRSKISRAIMAPSAKIANAPEK